MSYPSSLTDSQWSLVAHLFPVVPRPLGGRPVKYTARQLLDGIFYRLRTGCAWRQLPHDLPQWQSVYRAYSQWSADGTLRALHAELHSRVRAAEGRNPVSAVRQKRPPVVR